MEEEIDVPMPAELAEMPVPASEISLANFDPDILDSVIEQVQEYWEELKVMIPEDYPLNIPDDINAIDMNPITDLDPEPCNICENQYSEFGSCFKEISNGSRYVKFWNKDFPRGADNTNEFDTTVEYASGLVRAVVPWIVVGAILLLIPSIYLLIRHTACGGPCRKRAEHYKHAISNDKCHFWTFIFMGAIVFVSSLFGIIFGLTGNDRISVSLGDFADESKALTADIVDDVAELLQSTRDLTYAISNITAGFLELGLVGSIDEIINKGLVLIDDAAASIVAASESIEADVQDIEDSVNEAIDFINDLDNIRNAIYITSIVVIIIVGLAIIAAFVFRERMVGLYVGILVALVTLAAIAMMVAYLIYGLAAGDGCAQIVAYQERLQVSGSKWNINDLFQRGVFELQQNVTLMCEPLNPPTVIEKYFQCPEITQVLKLYGIGHFIEILMTVTLDATVSNCLSSDILFGTDNATMACPILQESAECGPEITNLACQMVDAIVALASIFTVSFEFMSCQDIDSVVQVTLADFCGDNMSGIYFSFVGYLCSIVGLVIGLWLLVYFMSRYKPKGLLGDEEAKIKNVKDREDFRNKVDAYRACKVQE